MKVVLVALLVCLVIFVVAAFATRRRSPKVSAVDEVPEARPPLTVREQPMYHRLTEAFPDHLVLAQVAFSSMLKARRAAVRNSFDRKVADFVVCTRGFGVLAVIELDDASHAGRVEKDQQRDALLTGAGYKVLRYPQVPDARTLREDVLRA